MSDAFKTVCPNVGDEVTLVPQVGGGFRIKRVSDGVWVSFLPGDIVDVVYRHYNQRAVYGVTDFGEEISPQPTLSTINQTHTITLTRVAPLLGFKLIVRSLVERESKAA